MSKQVQIKKRHLFEYFSDESIDFANKLIQRRESERLGTKGIEEIKNHPWFDGFEWEKLYTFEMKSPIKIRVFFCIKFRKVIILIRNILIL